MITEFAFFNVPETDADKFERAFAGAISTLRTSSGCEGVELFRQEGIGGFLMKVEWSEKASHNAFGEGPSGQSFLGAIGGFLTGAPADFFVEPGAVAQA